MTAMLELGSVQTIDTSTLSGAIETLDRDGPLTAEERLALALDGVLQAERAFVLAAKDSVGRAPSGRAAEFILAIEQHAERWSTLLCYHIRKRGGRPSPAAQDVHAQAMGIEQLHTRLVFLNDLQRSIVKQLNEIITLAHDDELYVDLTAMRRAHEARIGWMNLSLGQTEAPTKQLALAH